MALTPFSLRSLAFNHSGKKGTFNFLNGPMGYANAQRTINYIRIFTEFISQPEYVNVVPVFCIINEALVGTIGAGVLTSLCVVVLMLVLDSIDG